MKVCAIIPAYNEEKTIANVVEKVKEYVDDVFVIDDGSHDNTVIEARKAGARVISHPLNRGVGAALRTGYAIAIKEGYDYLVQIDADGQHNPDHIEHMLKLATDEDIDMLIASRFLNSSYRNFSLLRVAGIIFFSRLVSLLGSVKITDVTSGFRVYKVKALQKLGELPDTNWAITQTLEAAIKGLKIKEVSSEMYRRKEGKSQFNVKTFIKYPFRAIESCLRVLIFRRD